MRDGYEVARANNMISYARRHTRLANLIKPARRMLYRRCLRCHARLGLKNCVLPHAIRALDPEAGLAGRVFTMQGRPDPDCSVHESILRWTEFLSVAPEGHVIICQPQDHNLALMGELSAETLHLRGIRGYIVDGGCRDNAFIRKLNFPVFARFQTPGTSPAPGRSNPLANRLRSRASRSGPVTLSLPISTA